MKKFVDVACPQCAHLQIDAYVEIPTYPTCPTCNIPMLRTYLPGQMASVVGDDIPGGVEIKHGICNPDGTPKKYYSHSEIRRAADQAGYVNRPERGPADKKDWDRLSKRVR